jgi:hypothetical protein|tara:strand:- start:1384 stop:1638 length:255 start_codon:yes stop_codon:yes gene_type:complete
MNMIRLKDQDQFNGSNKVAELEAVIGETYSDNFSSTGRSRLMFIQDNGTCGVEEVASEYKSNTKIPKKGIQARPDNIVWNGFFY